MKTWLAVITMLLPVGLLSCVLLSAGCELKAVTPRPQGPVFVDNERPLPNAATGAITLVSVPTPQTSVRLYINGIRCTLNEDFTISGNVLMPHLDNVADWKALFTDARTVVTVDYRR